MDLILRKNAAHPPNQPASLPRDLNLEQSFRQKYHLGSGKGEPLLLVKVKMEYYKGRYLRCNYSWCYNL